MDLGLSFEHHDAGEDARAAAEVVLLAEAGRPVISVDPVPTDEEHGVRLEHIQPGKPQQNAYIERYNRTVRGEWLSQ